MALGPWDATPLSQRGANVQIIKPTAQRATRSKKARGDGADMIMEDHPTDSTPPMCSLLKLAALSASKPAVAAGRRTAVQSERKRLQKRKFECFEAIRDVDSPAANSCDRDGPGDLAAKRSAKDGKRTPPLHEKGSSKDGKRTPPMKEKGLSKDGNGKRTPPLKEKGSKRPWLPEEDAYLTKLVEQFGPKRWSFIASHFKEKDGRVGKQCRERWQNHLDPEVSHSPWTLEEERALMAAHADLGNRWVEIAKRIEGRTDSGCKNHFHKSAVQHRWRSIPTNQRWRVVAGPTGSLVVPDGPAPPQPPEPLVVKLAKPRTTTLSPVVGQTPGAATNPPACHGCVEQSPLSVVEPDREDQEVASAVSGSSDIADGKPMDVAAYALLSMMASTPE